jgi:serine/threonine-protein kinase
MVSTTMSQATTAFIGQTIAGRYRVVRQLGEGGQGHVFVAVQEALGREIALKVIRDELTSDLANVERFHREAKTVSELQHPHIVAIYDFGVHEGTLFMAMEKLKGQSLRQRLDAGAPISLGTSVAIVRDICSALAAAHALGVIHRDLKPDNVMLCEGAGRPDFAKVLDFGIAKRVDTEKFKQVTMQGMIVGTPGYLAPEVATGGHADDKVDLYALGVIWYEMLLGRSMFTALTPVALVMKHVIEVPARLSALGVDVNPDIEQLVFDLLAKDPSLRPPSAEAVVARLESLGFTTGTMPTPAAPPLAAPTTSSPGSAAVPPAASSGNALKLAMVAVGVIAILGGGGFGLSRLIKTKNEPVVAALPSVPSPPVAAPAVVPPVPASPAPPGPAAPVPPMPVAAPPVAPPSVARLAPVAPPSPTVEAASKRTATARAPKAALPSGKIVPKQVEGVKIFIGRELVTGNAPVSVVAGTHEVRITKGTRILSKRTIDVKPGQSIVIDAAKP